MDTRREAHDGAGSDLTMADLVGVGLLAAPGFVVPPLLGPTPETVALTLVTTLTAAGWVLHRAGLLRHRAPAGPAAAGATGERHTPVA
ncbi:hypothetical protein GCM10009737_19350 [Nocardioides lentus]|uniref:Uncharacterized protein n=1 Tax=Nocardioides lentus TaxID=338077 RepID=A0ABP5AR47_9ACTN